MKHTEISRTLIRVLSAVFCVSILTACGETTENTNTGPGSDAETTQAAASPGAASLALAETEDESTFVYEADRFADIRVLRYQVPGFDSLSAEQKELLYYLSQSALSGRDIMYDQNYKHNLRIRRTLEEVIEHYNGDRNTESFNNFIT